MAWIDIDDAYAVARRKAAGELTASQADALIWRLARGESMPPASTGAAGEAIERIRSLVDRGELTVAEGDAVIADLGSW